MGKILREVLAKDKSLLGRRDELIDVLEKKVPADKVRDFATIKRAISLNVGEKFFVGENNKSATTAEVEKILKSSGMRETRIAFVVEIFTKVLGWDKPLIPPSMQKKSDAQEVEGYTVTDDVPDVSDWPDGIIFCEPITFMFNEIAYEKGDELAKARKKFVNWHDVRSFTCANFEARMNDASLPPEFVDATDGEYWAVPIIDDRFAVFPNVKSYTANAHSQRAMGEVFRSNFTAGRTYNEIIVDKPAFFEYSGTVWRLKQQGALQLR